MQARRLELGLDTQVALADAAGLAKRTVTTVEGGRKVSDTTLTKLEHALRWEVGSTDDVLRGGEPTLVGRRRAAPQSVLARLRTTKPERLIEMRHAYAEFHGAEAADAWLAWAMQEQAQAPADTHPAAG